MTAASPRASINHITVHDGFTLADLFSYNDKHNEANGEDNRDGANDNHSNNCGHEGPTDDPAIIGASPPAAQEPARLPVAGAGPAADARRRRSRQHARTATTTPIARTTRSAGSAGRVSAARATTSSSFIAHLSEIRRRFPQIRAHRWLDGRRADGSYGVLWLTPAADDMKEQDWKFPEGRFLAYVLGPTEPGRRAGLHRAQCRARRDRVQAAEDARIQELAATIEHRRR